MQNTQDKYSSCHALLSPPLTPAESKKQLNPFCTSTRATLLPPLLPSRKQFVQDYGRMIYFLRPCSDPSIHKRGRERVFSLDLNLLPKPSLKPIRLQSASQTPTRLGKRNGNRCTRLDKTGASKKRPSVPAQPTEPKRVSRTPAVVNHTPTSPSGILTLKKEKADAAIAFDTIDIDTQDSVHFEPQWIPNPAALDQIPVKVVWKGGPLQINDQPYFDRLHPVEVSMASTLRLSPVQYLRCKRVLIRAAQEYGESEMPFRKSDAQKLCRVDVNKTSALWTVFGQLGWMGRRWPN
ncbi:Homeodomain-like protein [Phycomyces blakesleeanus]|uniref:Homeodomain-like protein n=1 Tax=Phycomyces blakesleeanus TaxID=4837 RepID=A0ABR3BGG2_PHYBL